MLAEPDIPTYGGGGGPFYWEAGDGLKLSFVGELFPEIAVLAALLPDTTDYLIALF